MSEGHVRGLVIGIFDRFNQTEAASVKHGSVNESTGRKNVSHKVKCKLDLREDESNAKQGISEIWQCSKPGQA